LEWLGFVPPLTSAAEAAWNTGSYRRAEALRRPKATQSQSSAKKSAASLGESRGILRLVWRGRPRPRGLKQKP